MARSMGRTDGHVNHSLTTPEKAEANNREVSSRRADLTDNALLHKWRPSRQGMGLSYVYGLRSVHFPKLPYIGQNAPAALRNG
jgi:hypothetical protein